VVARGGAWFWALWFAALAPRLASADENPSAKFQKPTGPQPSKVDAQKHADILHLLELTQAAAIGEQAAQQVFASLQKAMPTVKDEVFAELRKQVHAGELRDRLLPLYDKHFTAAEIKELLRFYETPLGKKLTQTLPALNQEALQIGQQWGSELSVRIKRRLDAAQLPKK